MDIKGDSAWDREEFSATFSLYLIQNALNSPGFRLSLSVWAGGNLQPKGGVSWQGHPLSTLHTAQVSRLGSFHTHATHYSHFKTPLFLV
jgi:hypothetical protein